MNEQLARLVRRMTARIYPLAAKKARIVVEFEDGSTTEIPVYLGKSSAATRDRAGIEKDQNAKKRLLACAPEKSAEPVSMKRLIKDAGLGWNHWNRNKIWELVEEGELLCIRNQFRKAK